LARKTVEKKKIRCTNNLIMEYCELNKRKYYFKKRRPKLERVVCVRIFELDNFMLFNWRDAKFEFEYIQMGQLIYS